MGMIYDLISVCAFLIVFKKFGFYAATATIVVLLFISIIGHRLKYKHYNMMQITIFAIVILLAIPTFLFHNELFFKWKPTIVSWVISFTLIIMQWLGKNKLFLQKTFEQHNINIPESCLKRINVAWISYFLLFGAINLYVAYHCDTDTWVNFKVYGSLGSSLLLTLLTVLYLTPHLKVDQPAKPQSHHDKT